MWRNVLIPVIVKSTNIRKKAKSHYITYAFSHMCRWRKNKNLILCTDFPVSSEPPWMANNTSNFGNSIILLISSSFAISIQIFAKPYYFVKLAAHAVAPSKGTPRCRYFANLYLVYSEYNNIPQQWGGLLFVYKYLTRFVSPVGPLWSRHR